MLKKRLRIKQGWVKSRTRLVASPHKVGITWDRDEIDRALARQHAKAVERGKQRKRGKQVQGQVSRLKQRAVISTLSEEIVHDSDSGMSEFWVHWTCGG